MFQLVVRSGKHQGQHLLLPAEKEILIGREDGCQIVLHSTLISRQHCSLRRTSEGIWATDLGSQNGTYVNEVLVTEPTLMVPGDTIRVGAIVFEVEGTGSSKSNTPTPPTGGKSDKKGSGISDADIANWLTDEEPAPANKTGEDTAVIRGRDSITPTPPTKQTTPAPPASGTATSVKKFRTVKDEAADIIRRHWARVKGQTPEAE